MTTHGIRPTMSLGFQRLEAPAYRTRAAHHGFSRSLGSVVVLLVWAVMACGKTVVDPVGNPSPDIDISAPWVEASVSEVGGSAAMVEAALAEASTMERLRSILVVKDGLLVVEDYFGTVGPDALHDVRSVTKSVISALVGLSTESGEITSLEDPIAKYLVPLTGPFEPAKQAITIEHLLTMTSGLEWDEPGGLGSYLEWLRSDDHIAFVLDKPLVFEPGTSFNYNSGASHLLGPILEQATATLLPSLAQEVLFGPIGVSRHRWEWLSSGSHNAGAGVDLRPRDLARFGQLYLQRGSSGGQRILPVGWVESSYTPRFDWRFNLGALHGVTYGYLWWTVPGAPEPLYFAWGHGGQYVVIVPDLNLVVVTTNHWPSMGERAPHYEEITMNLVVEQLIPAFR